uniref:Uncharacterized protein n=1 Tax=Acrobeloides nanus TaxID=290746 RepID=A0A914E1S4_9BILA
MLQVVLTYPLALIVYLFLYMIKMTNTEDFVTISRYYTIYLQLGLALPYFIFYYFSQDYKQAFRQQFNVMRFCFSCCK